MSMEINVNLNSNYAIQNMDVNSTANASKKRIGGASANVADRTEKVETSKEGGTSDYLSKLQKQVKDMKLKAGYSFAQPKGNITHCITVNPKLLEKMQNSPQMAKEYTQRLKDIQSASNYVTCYYKAKGDIVYYNDQWYIDENGNCSHFAQTIIKDRTNERMRKEAQKNAEKQIEKTRENIRKKAKELAEKLEEKLSASKDGVIYLYDTDIKTIMEAAKEAAGDSASYREQIKVGANFDLRI